jgi:hypothetical protein
VYGRFYLGAFKTSCIIMLGKNRQKKICHEYD